MAVWKGREMKRNIDLEMTEWAAGGGIIYYHGYWFNKITPERNKNS